MATEEEIAPETETAVEADFAFIIELDNVIGGARQAAYDVLASILKEKSVDFSEGMFSRYCMAAKPDYYIEQVQDATGMRKLSSRKLIEDVTNGVSLALSSSSIKLPAGLEKLVTEAQKRGMVVAAISALPEPVLASLNERLGLENMGIKLHRFSKVDQNFPRADAWLTVSKEYELASRNCLALASSMSACKSALTGGMRCIVVPDAFTEFQDFGGAQAVLDSVSSADAEEIFSYVPA